MSHFFTPLLAAALSLAGSDGPTPEQEDANLRALHVSGANAWAGGDRGVIWRSMDAGRSWQFQATPTALSLRGFSFLTDRIGWAAGGGIAAFTRTSVGVLLKTEDGGETWARIDQTPLPAIVAVRFFTPDRGLIACEPTDAAPSGLWTTEDGGATWTNLRGPRLGHWRAAALTGPERALLVGERGRIGLANGGSLQPSPTAPGGLPALTAVTAHGKNVYACGDGGRIWRSETAGRAWEPVAGPLPDGSASRLAAGATADDLDLRGLWANGETLAVCGAPGGLIFVRSADEDGELKWSAGSVGGTAPLNAVAFAKTRGPGGADSPYGLAVGDLGTIVRTPAAPADAAAAGWFTVRAGKRRATTLALVADPAETPFLTFATTAADDGHRAVAFCPVRRDLGAAAVQTAGEQSRLDAAVQTAGGSAGLVGWDFPISLPGSEENPTMLAGEWNERFEGPDGAGAAGQRL
ncbi:MAG: hypothetical protein AAF907_13800, partial [Planctomycetota bacterium]